MKKTSHSQTVEKTIAHIAKSRTPRRFRKKRKGTKKLGPHGKHRSNMYRINEGSKQVFREVLNNFAFAEVDAERFGVSVAVFKEWMDGVSVPHPDRRVEIIEAIMTMIEAEIDFAKADDAAAEGIDLLEIATAAELEMLKIEMEK